jgi:hypothetical protein
VTLPKTTDCDEFDADPTPYGKVHSIINQSKSIRIISACTNDRSEEIESISTDQLAIDFYINKNTQIKNIKTSINNLLMDRDVKLNKKIINKIILNF